MSVFKFPGVFVKEEQALGAIKSAGILATGFIGEAEKGPVDVPGLVTSFEEYKRLFGNFYKNKILPIAVKRFFDRAGEGNALYISRVVGPGSASSTVNMKDVLDVADSLKIDAYSPGLHGNRISMNTVKFEGTVAADVSAGAITTLTLVSTLGIDVGDWIVFEDSASNRHAALVIANDLIAKTLTIPSLTLVAQLDEDSVVKTASVHRVNSALSAEVLTNATQAILVDASEVAIGSVLTFVEDQKVEVVVTNINGNTVTFAAITLTSSLPSATRVVSQEFNIEVLINESFLQLHEYLSMEGTNQRDYVEVRLLGKNSESTEIVATDLGTTQSQLGLQAPVTGVALADTNVQLASGLDGSAPVDNDVLGSNPPIGETRGLGNFNDIQNLPHIVAPGFTSVVVEQGLNTWAKNRGDSFAILEAPLADDTTLELVEFRDNELNLDTSYAALYAPHLIINNPGISGNKLEFPPGADVAGKMVETVIRRGLQKAPANELLDDVLGLTAELGDAAQNILNPKGVNIIRNFPGQGIRIFGGRTLRSVSNGFEYINIRKQFNFIKVSLKDSMRSRLFEPNTPALQDDVRFAVSTFFDSLIPSGFFATTDPKTAYFIKIDAETNPPSVVNQGKLVAKIGLNLPKPVEQIEFSMFLSQENGVDFAGI